VTERDAQDVVRSPHSPWLPAVATAVCAILLGFSMNVAASLVPSEWTHHHQLVVWGIVAVLAISSVVLAAAGRRENRHIYSIIDRRIEAETITGPIIIIEPGSSVPMGDVIGAPPSAPPVGVDASSAGPGEPLLPSGPPFLNRDREVGELVTRVQAGEDSLLAIEGDHWIGKSAAATALVQTLLEDPPEGAFDPRERRFVWLNAGDACPTLAEICGVLALDTGEQALTTAPMAEKRAALRSHLARSGTVLVLDNLRLTDDSRSRELIDLLEDLPQGSLVIASVNRPGALVAPRVNLGDLDEDNVHELIADRVRRLNVDGIEQFDEAFSKRLRASIGGNPGVIEWFLRGYRDSSDPLEQRIAAIEKGAELSELFEPTWKALQGDHRRVLEACTYLYGEATVQQISIVCERSAADMQTAAEELRRDGLLTPVRRRDRPTVFTCAKAFQRFVAARTPGSRRTAFTERLADHYIGHFTDNPEDAGYGLTEVGALRVVREQLFEDEDDARIQALFWVVLDILFTLGQFDELIAAADLSFKSGDRVQNFSGAALGAVIKACTHAIRDERALALESWANGQVAAENSGLPSPIARAKRCRAFLHYRAREPRQALAEIEGVAQLAHDGNDPLTIVDAYDLQTAANWYLRRLKACEAAARDSLQTGEAIGWKRARAFPLRFLAELAIQRRRWREARELLDEACDIATQFRDKRQLARINLTQARLGLLEGTLESGEAAAHRAVAETTRLGLPPEQEEAIALATAIDRARRSALWRRYYWLRRPTRLSGAPVGGD
jgi:hypothetical protein